jgi:hypothetical protein
MRKSSIAFLAIVTTMLVAIAGAAPAGAANTRVSGNQTPDLGATCPEPSLGTYTMDGGLVGCWYTDDFSVVREHPSGAVQLKGTEHFVGCLDLEGDASCTGDPSGTLRFAFQFSGWFDLDTFAEIRGRCEHLIVSGIGDFSDAGGVITFKDDVTTGIATYSGNVRL